MRIIYIELPGFDGYFKYKGSKDETDTFLVNLAKKISNKSVSEVLSIVLSAFTNKLKPVSEPDYFEHSLLVNGNRVFVNSWNEDEEDIDTIYRGGI